MPLFHAQTRARRAALRKHAVRTLCGCPNRLVLRPEGIAHVARSGTMGRGRTHCHWLLASRLEDSPRLVFVGNYPRPMVSPWAERATPSVSGLFFGPERIAHVAHGGTMGRGRTHCHCADCVLYAYLQIAQLQKARARRFHRRQTTYGWVDHGETPMSDGHQFNKAAIRCEPTRTPIVKKS